MSTEVRLPLEDVVILEQARWLLEAAVGSETGLWFECLLGEATSATGDDSGKGDGAAAFEEIRAVQMFGTSARATKTRARIGYRTVTLRCTEGTHLCFRQLLAVYERAGLPGSFLRFGALSAMHSASGELFHLRKYRDVQVHDVDLFEVRSDVPHRHPAGIHGEDLVVETAEVPLMLGHQLRLEAAFAIPAVSPRSSVCGSPRSPGPS